MADFTLLVASPGVALYSIQLDATDFPPPTKRFRAHALSCGLYFLNSLTFSAFVTEARHQFDSRPNA